MKVVCVGYFLKDRMLKAGYPDTNIRVIPNFTDLDVDRVEMPVSGIPQFLFMGRLQKLKGLDWLLRSFKNVKSPAVLNICGEGDEEQRLKTLVKELEMEHRVKFFGWIDRDTKINLLQSARALIVPSVWHETFGLVAIEAAACARPVIVSNVGELPHIVEHGEDGIVVDVGDIQLLSQAIDDLAIDYEKARQMGLKGQAKCKIRYTPHAHKSQLDEVYAGFVARYE
jgi:glycosyltransferase involved in cell wall biosynthesis